RSDSKPILARLRHSGAPPKVASPESITLCPWLIGIGAVTSPATPPGMRVRTGRFDGLRLLGKAGNPQLCEESGGQREMETVCRRLPPSSAVGSYAPGGAVCHTAGDHRPIDDGAAFPVLELHRTQAMANPLVEVVEDARGLGEPEVTLPSVEIAPEALADLREALPGGTPGHRAYTLLQALDGLRCQAPANRSSRGHPEGEAKELPCRGARHLALGLVDAQLQPPKELAQRCHHPLARPLRPHIDVEVVSVAHERMPASLQLLVHLVQEHVGQERRQRAALRRSFLTLHHHPVREH